jgi:uncharacterized damage-inducible protein DinB
MRDLCAMSNSTTDLVIKMTLTSWEGQNKRFLELIDKLSDDTLQREIAPGKNTGIYLLGHMIAAHDGMLPLMGLGERLYPEMEDVFLRTPDKSGKPFTATPELRSRLKAIIDVLNRHFAKLSTEEWLSRHNAVSPEDFAKEPTRNKLNIVISRTVHLASHMGQMLYLKS